jgi:hypothetical protein
MRVRRQMELTKGQALNLSIIWVGWHSNPSVSQVTDEDRRRVMSGLQKMRDIYGKVDLGIRRIYYSHITPGSAGSYTFINSKVEAYNLTDDWYGDNDGLDVFWVPGIKKADGWGPGSAGPCDKDDKDDMTGVVCELGLDEEFNGVLVAHEVGHYLGLGHGTDINNFMGKDDKPPYGVGETNANSTGITSGQGNTMKSHCYIKPPCA